jgi:hypothetical protein
MKKLTIWMGVLALGACLFGTEHAAQADFTAVTIPTQFNVWGPTATSRVSYPFQCVPGIPCAPTDFVRGDVSIRHARDRVFYNTTSNSGYYWRSLGLLCSDGTNQGAPIGPFHTDADGDLTLFCSGSSYVAANAGITSI